MILKENIFFRKMFIVIHRPSLFKKNECTFRIDCSHIEFNISCHASDGIIPGEQKNVTRFHNFFLLLFYQFAFVVGLLQGFMINAHESGSNSLGTGTFSRDLTKPKSLQCRDFTWALHMEKSISLLFPGPQGTWLQMTGALRLVNVC